MGIYSTGKVYGIKWDKYNEHQMRETIYEKIFETEMTLDNIKEVKKIYDTITEPDKLFFYTYDECCATYEPGNNSTFMTWFGTGKEQLDEWFASKLK